MTDTAPTNPYHDPNPDAPFGYRLPLWLRRYIDTDKSRVVGGVRYISRFVWKEKDAHKWAREELYREISKRLIEALEQYDNRPVVIVPRFKTQWPHPWDEEARHLYSAPNVDAGSIAVEIAILPLASDIGPR